MHSARFCSFLMLTSRFRANKNDITNVSRQQISNLKMPKLKQTSSSYVVSQAKKQKKNQPEQQGGLPRHQKQTRRECDVEAHQSAHRDPVRQQLEQEQNTAAQ